MSLSTWMGLMIVIAWGLFIVNPAISEKTGQAMKVCQLSHSHDVCFQTLNR